MAEPVGITLASVALFAPIFHDCDSLWKGFKQTRSFGNDFELAKISLSLQHVRLKEILRRKLADLHNSHLDVADANDETTSAIINCLVLMKSHFKECYHIVQKYERRDQSESESSIDRNAPTDASYQVPSLSMGADASSTPAGASTPVSGSWTTEHISAKSKGVRRYLEKMKVVKRKPSKTLSSSVMTPLSPPSSLDVARIKLVEELVQEEAEKTQKASNIARRAHWVHSIQPVLEQRIIDLRNANNDLDHIVRLRESEDCTRTLWKPGVELPELSSVQGSLQRLHKAFMTPNCHGKFHLSVQLASNYAEMRQQDSMHAPYLPLRENSDIFHIQHHVDATSNSKKTRLLLVETLKEPPKDVLPDDGPTSAQFLPLKTLEVPALELESETDFKMLGSLSGSDGHDRHHVFYDIAGNWSIRKSLHELLTECEFSNQAFFIRRLQLATILTLSYIYFAKLRVTCKDPRPSNYIFYKLPNDRETWHDEDSFIFQPYLSFGFGSPPPKRRIGAMSGLSASGARSPLTELGLLLYQVGRGRVVDYGMGQEGVLKARNAAMERLADLEQECGTRFVEIVRTCLEFKSDRIGTSRPATEDEACSRVVTELQDCVEELLASIV